MPKNKRKSMPKPWFYDIIKKYEFIRLQKNGNFGGG